MVEAAAALLAEGGRDAVSTRAVSAAARVQAPAIYRQFGDMQGLLDAVASYGFEQYLAAKAERPHADDPVEDLREGWRMHVEFGLSNPDIYLLMYAQPTAATASHAVAQADEILRGLVERVAGAGRLRVSVRRAARMLHAAAMGVTLELLATAGEDQDVELSEATCDAILAAITTDSGIGLDRAVDSRAAAHAVALQAVLGETTTELSPAERALMTEWLDRIARAAG